MSDLPTRLVVYRGRVGGRSVNDKGVGDRVQQGFDRPHSGQGGAGHRGVPGAEAEGMVRRVELDALPRQRVVAGDGGLYREGWP